MLSQALSTTATLGGCQLTVRSILSDSFQRASIHEQMSSYLSIVNFKRPAW
jgi:hypothetical protein